VGIVVILVGTTLLAWARRRVVNSKLLPHDRSEGWALFGTCSGTERDSWRVADSRWVPPTLGWLGQRVGLSP
jgi:hypothetical protein